MKKIVLFLLFITSYTAFAQVIFEAKTDQTSYPLNDKIQLRFEMNVNGDNFIPPQIEGFYAEGPMTSIGTNYSNINGKVTRELKKTLTYFLRPTKKGTFTIPEAQMEYGGEIFKTKPIKITITNAVERPKDPNDPEFLAGEGTFLVAEVSNSNPYVNEPITIIYKLYFDPNFSLSNIREEKNPKFNGFWSQFFEIKDLKAELAKYNGKDYAMVAWRKVLLYPQDAGKQTLEPLVLNAEISIPVKRKTFFGYTYVYENVNRNISSLNKTINVKALPENGKPEDFSGAVGTFDFSVKPNKTSINFGEALEVEVAVSGKGNLKLLTLPKVEFPSSFDAYEPKHNEKIDIQLSGMTGKVTENYTLVPQVGGKYTIKPITFSYFDLATKTYKTKTSEEFSIEIIGGPKEEELAKEENNTPNAIATTVFQEIKTATQFVSLKKPVFMGTYRFYLFLFLPLVLMPLVYFGKQKAENYFGDITQSRIRQNNRLANRFLKQAKKQLGNKVPFYLALEKAVHNFLKAKLKIETTEMSKENIQDLLQNRNISEKTTDLFIQIMENCEFARYAPSSTVAMQEDYEKAVQVITEIQKDIHQ